ncbi:MAG: TonB-dependent receptor [Bacteroidetes bacterium]|nr:TonB-dependent receptor [Bacteroidota bacterium]MBT6686457.1 TonB-dependent receptor [Bacteroidota bacterium]MBT7142869.1 TonB-dependent receptor [Bacteroidota bacterium]MBT7490510.1 TonB-dependent receptor [Bacteroidota bacterium]
MRKSFRKINLLVFIMVFVSLKFYGAPILGKCEVNGVVKDSISGEGLPFATIRVLTTKDSSFVKGVMTNAEGNYLINDIQTGEYIIIASYMGYHERKIVLNIQSKKVKFDFLLIQKSISLSEISITAEKNLVEKKLEKTTVNVSKNTTVSGGTATDVMQTLPSVDVDIDGNINYRGSDKVIILINGEKSELVKSLDQIPADQIEKVELINNPSAKYEAEGMSGIINIVLKSGKPGKNKTTLMINGGYSENVGGNIGYSGTTEKTAFFINAGIKHNTKFQTKEHLRENYENPNAFNYYQYDRQDESLNDAFLNTNFDYKIRKNQKIGISLIGSKKFNNADRTIDYETLTKSGQKTNESLKEIGIDLNNYTIDGILNYRYNFKKGRFLSSKIHYSLFDQLQVMNNKFYPDLPYVNPELQNTYSKQINKQTDFSLDYLHPFNDSLNFETGYDFSVRDLLNDFSSEIYTNSGEWLNNTALANKFNYIQMIHAVYFSFSARLKFIELQAGLRSELTSNSQNDISTDEYIDFFPSLNISRKLNNHFSIFAGYNRRINRPTIKMLNPFSDEYADILNMHKGNPDLKPEYVNSIEIGNRFVFNKFSGLGSIYYRNIDHAISRIKSASNDSAMFVSFMNLDKAKLIGGEISLTYKPFKWWSINSSSNIFYTNLSGEYENNLVNNSKTGWTLNISNNFKLPKDFGFQLSGYYRSKLPSVMGTYKERYYFDLALNKKILKNKAQLIFKISDVFNTYKFGLDLDAIDDNNFRYSQINRRKNESRYFILSFIYNINGKDQQQKKQKENFFLDDFDK